MVKRFQQNPIITTDNITPSQEGWVVECVLNPGVFRFNDLTWLLLRVAERPIQKNDTVSFPVMNGDGKFKIMEFDRQDPLLDLSDPRMVGHNGKTYLSTISHLRLVCSHDGVHFSEPEDFPTKIFGKGTLETYGIEDCRVSVIEGVYHLTYTQVSESGVGVGLMRTVDWRSFSRDGMILPPHNKDCALFEEKINGLYYCMHRPSGIGLGGNYIWVSSSRDLVRWGQHQCILQTRKGWWDSERIGAGAAPIKTREGWLEIYHGADENQRYCLGAVLLDLDNPAKVIARSQDPILEPDFDYELSGFFGNVVFTNGHLVDGDEITLYYGASDQVICGAKISIEDLLSDLLSKKQVSGAVFKSNGVK